VCTENLIPVGARQSHLQSEPDDRPDTIRFTNGDRLSSFGSIVSSPQRSTPFGSSDPRPWCGGTVSVFDVTGVGRDREVVAHKSARICALIRRMSVDNPLWGAPRIGQIAFVFLAIIADGRIAISHHGQAVDGWMVARL